jgi:radical SAM protein with 4Fe4S-binding SPASM domain
MPGPEELDSLPMPDYSDFKDDMNLWMYREPHRLDIFDSRGCPTHCHFCSEWQFWGRFRSKSGKRIYDEVLQHMQDFPQVNYFYFSGSLVNGDMLALEEFCDLVIANRLKTQWAGQAIIRPEMTGRFLQKMKRSGCVWISYGIESGSGRVLDKMNKRFSLEVANRVLQDTKEAGIATQVNFMFGLPTETLDDFNQTLGFLKDNRKYMDTILASQSFCVIDKGTYLYEHPGEFAIKGKKHHLYWESNNGENNYPERFRRYEEFCQLALSLGIPETSGVLKTKPDKWQLLGDYYFYKRDYKLAIENYLNAQRYEIKNRTLLDKLSKCYEETGDYDKAIETLNNSLQLECSSTDNNGIATENIMYHLDYLKDLSKCIKTISNINAEQRYKDFSLIESAKLAKILQYFIKINFKGIDLEKIISDFKFNEKQKSMSRALYSHGLWTKLSNYILTDVQKARKEAFLFGYPYWLVIDPCNYCTLHCPFCPTGQGRQVRTKGKLSFTDFKDIIDKLGPYLIHIDLVNWGEPLLNEQIFDMAKYAKQYHSDIKIDTNLNHLDEDGAKRLVLSGLDKIVVSIDGLTEETYSKYRVGGNFQLAMNNLKLIIKKRKELKMTKPYITWQFLVFRHNEHEIKQVIRMGKKLGVNHVGISNAFIGDREWIPLNPNYSNYNIKEISSNELTSEHFKLIQESFCSWPWEAIAINPNGSVSSCCSVEEEKDDFGNIFDQPFEELWNDEKYQMAREYIRNRNQNITSDKNICAGCRHSGLINIDILSCHSFFKSL